MLTRFQEKVSLAADGCWEWTGSHNGQGYGRFYLDGKKVYTHRYAYEQTNGPIPDGLVIDHLCRNPKCCNPEHLEPVTVSENALRGLTGKTERRLKTHCKRGHEYNTENTAIRAGKRFCRACQKIHNDRRKTK